MTLAEVQQWVSTVTMVFLMVCLLLVILWLTGVVTPHIHTEPFADTSATAIMCKQVMENRPSLCDKVEAADRAVAASNAAKSTLTGTRDVPVFFQDYDYEMQQKGSNLYNDREGNAEGYRSRESYEDNVANNAVGNIKSSELMDALKGY
jgi:hypothetical protein